MILLLCLFFPKDFSPKVTFPNPVFPNPVFPNPVFPNLDSEFQVSEIFDVGIFDVGICFTGSMDKCSSNRVRTGPRYLVRNVKKAMFPPKHSIGSLIFEW